MKSPCLGFHVLVVATKTYGFRFTNQQLAAVAMLDGMKAFRRMLYAIDNLGALFTPQQLFDAAMVGGGNVFDRMLRASEKLNVRFTLQQLVAAFMLNPERARVMVNVVRMLGGGDLS